MKHQSDNLTGLEKASILLMSIGAAASAKVFEQLSPSQRELLGAQIVKLKEINEDTRQKVLDEVKKQLAGSNESLPFSEEPLKWMESLDAEIVASRLCSERPSMIALVLSQLSPRYAADVLSKLDERIRNQAALALVRSKSASRETILNADQAMRRRFVEVNATKEKARLFGILNNVTKKVKSPIELIKTKKAAQTEYVETYTLECLSKLLDSEIRIALRQIEPADLSKVLSFCSDEVKEIMLRNMSKEKADIIRRDLASGNQITVRAMEAAQKRIGEVLHDLVKEGKIGNLVSPRGGVS